MHQTQMAILRRLDNLRTMCLDIAEHDSDPENREWHEAKAAAYKYAITVVYREFDAAKEHSNG